MLKGRGNQRRINLRKIYTVFKKIKENSSYGNESKSNYGIIGYII